MIQPLPQNPTTEQMDKAYSSGLLRKEQLEHGCYYRGSCRNAEMARWHGQAQCFVHWREKVTSRFLECIKHPEDERIYDVFLAVEEVEPGDQSIPDEQFAAMFKF